MKNTIRSTFAYAAILSLAAVTFGCDQQRDHKQEPKNPPSSKNATSTTTDLTNKDAANKLAASDFVGNWKVSDGDNIPFYITLNKDGSAVATWEDGRTGTWKIVNDKALVIWEDGWTTVIYKSGTGYKKDSYAPGKSVSGVPTNTSSADKVTNIPAAKTPSAPSYTQKQPSPSQNSK
jgi:hypothetical protein